MPKQTTQNNDELAGQIARDLGEAEDISFFRILIKRYPEALIRRAHEQTLKIPAEKIRKTRGALFLYLLKKYARREEQQHSQADTERE